jgi:oligosaccharide repeat unit polymerase
MPSSFSKSWQGYVVIWTFAFALVHIWLHTLLGEKDWFSIDKLFIGAYFYFHYDYLIAYLLGIVKFRDTVFISPKYANFTTYLISNCLFFFLLGYDIFYPKLSHRPLLPILKGLVQNATRGTFFIGKLMILVGFGLVVTFILRIGLTTLLNRSYGFDLFYSGEYDISSFAQGKGILAVGVIFLLLDQFQARHFSLTDKLTNMLLVLVIAVYAAITAVIFSVRSWLLLDIFIPGIMIYHYFRRQISIKWLIAIVTSVLVISVMIQISRTSNTRTISGFLNAYQQNQQNYGFGDSLTTQWRTYKNVNESVALINLEGHWFYGSTLLGGVFAGIPFVGKYLNQGWYEDPSFWLARNMEPWFYSNHEGIGFSLPAETYINFGLIGSCIFFLLLGYLCAMIYTRIILNQSERLLLIVLYMAFVPSLLFSIRQTLSSIVRPVMVALVVTIIILFVSKVLQAMGWNRNEDHFNK